MSEKHIEPYNLLKSQLKVKQRDKRYFILRYYYIIMNALLVFALFLAFLLGLLLWNWLHVTREIRTETVQTDIRTSFVLGENFLYSPQGKSSQVKEGQKLLGGESIHTGMGEVLIELTNGYQLHLLRNSSLEIKLKRDSYTHDQTVEFVLLKGQALCEGPVELGLPAYWISSPGARIPFYGGKIRLEINTEATGTWLLGNALVDPQTIYFFDLEEENVWLKRMQEDLDSLLLETSAKQRYFFPAIAVIDTYQYKQLSAYLGSSELERLAIQYFFQEE